MPMAMPTTNSMVMRIGMGMGMVMVMVMGAQDNALMTV